MSQAEIKGEKRPMMSSRRARATVWICLTAIGIVVAGLLLYWHYAEPPLSRYGRVIALLEQNKIHCDRPGHVDLSQTFSGLTPHDEMLMTQRDDGSFLAMFPTQYGEGTQLSGLMYTSRPLRVEDTRLRKSPIRFSDRIIEVGTYSELLIDSRINEHWYRVSYRIR